MLECLVIPVLVLQYVCCLCLSVEQQLSVMCIWLVVGHSSSDKAVVTGDISYKEKLHGLTEVS